MRAAPALRACAWLLLAVLVACGGEPPAPSALEPPMPAELRTGDVTVRATTLPVARLNRAMAQQYGVTGDSGDVLLVVGLRRGPQASEASVPGRVTADARDLLGKRQRIALRQVRSEGFIDYVGTVRVAMPDTLHFEIRAHPEGAPAATLRFNRDFFPVR